MLLKNSRAKHTRNKKKMAEIRKCIYVSIYISYTFSFLSLYISPLISDDSAFYLRKRIHIEHLSTNDEVIIKSWLSFVVPSRLFGHAPVYFRKWPLIQTALSLSFREDRFYPGTVNPPRPEGTLEAGVLRYFLFLLISHDATIKDSGLMETVGDIP